MKNHWLQALSMKYFTPMLVQKIATKGANFLYPSHMKKTHSVLMYVELKKCDSIELFYISIQYELCLLVQYENLILWQNGTW
jgi:hypothetical protein